MSVDFPCIWKSFNIYGTFCATKSSVLSGSIVELWGEIRMNMEIWIDYLQVVIDIFNLWGLDECNHIETRMYLCGDVNVPVPVTIGITL